MYVDVGSKADGHASAALCPNALPKLSGVAPVIPPLSLRLRFLPCPLCPIQSLQWRRWPSGM